MKQIAERFEKFLRTRGLRLTRQRAAILRAIYGTHRHVSADQLYAMLHKDGQADELDISRATVYRTLSLLAEGGFVQALDLGRDTGALYEHTLGHAHHDHMICLECGRIIEFSDSRLEQVQDEAVKRHGFRAQSHRLNVFGTCDRCLAAASTAGSDVEPDPGDKTPGTGDEDDEDDESHAPDAPDAEPEEPEGATDGESAPGT